MYIGLSLSSFVIIYIKYFNFKYFLVSNTFKYFQILSNTFKYFLGFKYFRILFEVQILSNTFKYFQILSNTFYSLISHGW
jgi:hypothetical protein